MGAPRLYSFPAFDEVHCRDDFALGPRRQSSKLLQNHLALERIRSGAPHHLNRALSRMCPLGILLPLVIEEFAEGLGVVSHIQACSHRRWPARLTPCSSPSKTLNFFGPKHGLELPLNVPDQGWTEEVRSVAHLPLWPC